MKQYYESEVLFQLMERDGLNIPSSVPPYEAEIKAYLINQVKQAYPKLTDYEAEWLLYNYTKHLPAEFPISSVLNVTEATFENVVPFAYQSAILKGNTLVNVLSYVRCGGGAIYNKTDDLITVDSNGETTWNTVDLALTQVKKNTKYIVMWDSVTISKEDYSPAGSFICIRKKSDNVQISSMWVKEKNYVVATTTDDIDIVLRIHATQGTPMSNITTVKGLKVLEYQEGMENWDIPYFEGMQSVKIPVLTTSNEDGTKTNILTVNEPVELRGIGDVKDELNLITGELTQRIGEVVLDGSEDIETWGNYGFYVMGNTTSGSLTISMNNKYQSYVNASALSKATGNGIAVNSNNLYIKTNEFTSVTEFTDYLQSNPITVQYELATESIKTVDLTTVNEKGKTTYFMPLEGTMSVQSSGEIIKPSFDMSVPVEATTQNLASFIDMEMEE